MSKSALFAKQIKEPESLDNFAWKKKPFRRWERTIYDFELLRPFQGLANAMGLTYLPILRHISLIIRLKRRNKPTRGILTIRDKRISRNTKRYRRVEHQTCRSIAWRTLGRDWANGTGNQDERLSLRCMAIGRRASGGLLRKSSCRCMIGEAKTRRTHCL